MAESINIDLIDLQDIMNDLPDHSSGVEHCRNALTREDIMVIARVVQAVSHKSCAMGFESDEIRKIKSFIKTLNGGMLVVGYAILAAVGAGVVSICIWAIKHGVMDIVQSAQKGVGK